MAFPNGLAGVVEEKIKPWIARRRAALAVEKAKRRQREAAAALLDEPPPPPPTGGGGSSPSGAALPGRGTATAKTALPGALPPGLSGQRT
jgi:urea transport system permease protein